MYRRKRVTKRRRVSAGMLRRKAYLRPESFFQQITGRGDYLIGNRIVPSPRRKGTGMRSKLTDALPAGASFYVAPKVRYVGGRTLDRLGYGPVAQQRIIPRSVITVPTPGPPTYSPMLAPPTTEPRDFLGLSRSDWTRPYEPSPSSQAIARGFIAAVPGLQSLVNAAGAVRDAIVPMQYQSDHVRADNLRRIMRDSVNDRRPAYRVEHDEL